MFRGHHEESIPKQEGISLLGLSSIGGASCGAHLAWRAEGGLEGGLAEEPGKLRLLKELGAGEEEPGELGTGVEERAVAHT